MGLQEYTPQRSYIQDVRTLTEETMAWGPSGPGEHPDRRGTTALLGTALNSSGQRQCGPLLPWLGSGSRWRGGADSSETSGMEEAVQVPRTTATSPVGPGCRIQGRLTRRSAMYCILPSHILVLPNSCR